MSRSSRVACLSLLVVFAGCAAPEDDVASSGSAQSEGVAAPGVLFVEEVEQRPGLNLERVTDWSRVRIEVEQDDRRFAPASVPESGSPRIVDRVRGIGQRFSSGACRLDGEVDLDGTRVTIEEVTVKCKWRW